MNQQIVFKGFETVKRTYDSSSHSSGFLICEEALENLDGHILAPRRPALTRSRTPGGKRRSASKDEQRTGALGPQQVTDHCDASLLTCTKMSTFWMEAEMETWRG